MDAALMFKTLSDQTRLRCLTLLASHDELCVCELTFALGLPQPKVSHHLGALRKAGVVSDRKVGLWIFYRLNPALPAWARAVVDSTVEGLRGEEPYLRDRRALSAMPNRPGVVCSV